jgi:hypothetical protein
MPKSLRNTDLSDAGKTGPYRKSAKKFLTGRNPSAFKDQNRPFLPNQKFALIGRDSL